MSFFYDQYDADIRAVANSHDVSTLLSCWEQAGDGTAPAYAAFNLSHIRKFADDIFIAQRTNDSDYQVVYASPSIEDQLGTTVCGRYVAELGGKVGPYLQATFKRAEKSAKAIYSIHSSELIKSVHTWEMLALPVCQTAGANMLICYIRPLQYHHQLLEAILETCMDGVVSMNAVRDNDGKIIDATVTSANPAAGRLLGQKQRALLGSRLLALFPGMLKSGHWGIYQEVIESGESCQYEVELETSNGLQAFRANLVQLGDGLTVTFSDITESTQAKKELEKRQDELLDANQHLETQAMELAALATSLETARMSLNEEIARREELELELRRHAETDFLTSVANRRHFLDKAAGEIRRSRRNGHDLSVIMFDIDHFKKVNDTHGHAVGDLAIMTVCEVSRVSSRDGVDLIGRLGGEEFALLVPETDTKGATAVAERLRTKIASTEIADGDTLFNVTVSLGVATMTGSDTDIDSILRRADAALYEAKRGGRDRVAIDAKSDETIADKACA